MSSWQGDNTDDEDCIGQYQPPLTRPMAPTDGAMQWMSLARRVSRRSEVTIMGLGSMGLGFRA